MRWLKTDLASDQLSDIVRLAGDHALLFRGDQQPMTLFPQSEQLRIIHKNIKQAFDPFDILNREYSIS